MQSFTAQQSVCSHVKFCVFIFLCVIFSFQIELTGIFAVPHILVSCIMLYSLKNSEYWLCFGHNSVKF